MRSGLLINKTLKRRSKANPTSLCHVVCQKKGDVLSCAVLALTVPLTKVFKQQTKDGKIWGKVPLT